MRDVEIRRTIASDLDALADVLVEVHAADGYPVEGVDDPRAWLALDSPLGQWTALLDGAPVGHVALTRSTPDMDNPIDGTVTLSRLFLAPSARGNSFGAMLVDVVERQARVMDLTLVLDVMMKDEAAIALYESRGWAKVKEFEHVHSGGERTPAILMIAPQIKERRRGRGL